MTKHAKARKTAERPAEKQDDVRRPVGSVTWREPVEAGQPVQQAYGEVAAAPPMSDAPLLLPDGRDARVLGLIELWSAVSPIVPRLNQGDGKDALLAAYEAHVWAGLVAKLDPAERLLVERVRPADRPRPTEGGR